MVAISNSKDTFCDVRCGMCCRYFTIFYNRKDMVDWLSGSLPIQDAMPYLTDGERELFLSYTCNDCFNNLFGLDNDE